MVVVVDRHLAEQDQVPAPVLELGGERLRDLEAVGRDPHPYGFIPGIAGRVSFVYPAGGWNSAASGRWRSTWVASNTVLLPPAPSGVVILSGKKPPRAIRASSGLLECSRPAVEGIADEAWSPTPMKPMPVAPHTSTGPRPPSSVLANR